MFTTFIATTTITYSIIIIIITIIRYDSLVNFAPNGNMIFAYFSGDDVKNVRGTWSEGRNKVLKMIIERTYKGRSSEFTTKSIYVGVNSDIDNNNDNNNDDINVTFKGGEIFDESCDIDDVDDSSSKFILSSIGATINFIEKRRTLSTTTTV